jgi:hypothetical protein
MASHGRRRRAMLDGQWCHVLTATLFGAQSSLLRSDLLPRTLAILQGLAAETEEKDEKRSSISEQILEDD